MSTLDPHREALERLRADLARVVEAYPELRRPEARERLAGFLASGQVAADSLAAAFDASAFCGYDNSHG